MPEQTPSPEQPIDQEAYYEVMLSKSVMYGGRQHSPMHRTIIKGIAWPQFKDAIISSRKIPPGDEGKL